MFPARSKLFNHYFDGKYLIQDTCLFRTISYQSGIYKDFYFHVHFKLLEQIMK